MKVISYNVNGIRAAISKGFDSWLASELPDIIHIQETKAFAEQVDVTFLEKLGYNYIWHAAEKKGYSGVATFSKHKIAYSEIGIGINNFDCEGRLIRLDIEDITFINSYFPSGTMGDIRQTVKEAYLESVLQYINELKKKKDNIIVSGDFNICHKPIDINSPERHKNSSGFLLNEREWMDRFLNLGFVDSFRLKNLAANQYSWWSYRANSREKNLGWRIDYHMVSSALANKVTNAYILNNVVHSDHCPVVVELQL